GSELTLRANTPIRTPAIMPLMVEPKTIPRSWFRTAGVNQAESPSKIPRIPPRTSPNTILFISLSPSQTGCSTVVLTAFAQAFNSATRKKKEQHAHEQVCQHQDHGHLVMPEETNRALQDLFP